MDAYFTKRTVREYFPPDNFDDNPEENELNQVSTV